MYNAFKLGNIDIISTKMGNYADYVGTIGYSRKEYIGRNFDFLSLNYIGLNIIYKCIQNYLIFKKTKNNE